MSKVLITHADIVLLEDLLPDSDVLIENGALNQIGRINGSLRGARRIDAKRSYLIPGLIDIHLNGAFGKSFASASSVEIRSLSEKLCRHGVTAFIASLISLPHRKMISAITRLRSLVKETGQGARLLGIHLEGPFLNPLRRGAHRKEHVRPPSIKLFRAFLRAGRGTVRMMTLAPELPGILPLIHEGNRRRVVMALGHSDARLDAVERAVEAGARHVTHVYNAMRGFHHRDPGILDAALLDDRLSGEIIYDRHHISRTAAQLVLRCKPIRKIVLVSDATAAWGAPDGTYDFEGTSYVVQRGRVTVQEEGQLGGSVVSLIEGVRNLHDAFHLTLPTAVRLATWNPARVLSLEDRVGSIEIGKRADLVILNRDWTVRSTLLRGKVIYGSDH